MINHKELRPGNLVMYYDGQLARVSADQIRILEKTPELAMPIGLTKELLDCIPEFTGSHFNNGVVSGFRYRAYIEETCICWEQYWRGIDASHPETFFRLYGSGYDDWGTELPHITTLHALQNLYYALSGKELEVRHG